MDPRHDRTDPAAEPGALDLPTPGYARDISHMAANTPTRLTPSWDLASLAPEGSLAMRDQFSGLSSLSRSSERLSFGSRVDMAQDILAVERSRILEQLRNATVEVDQLEYRLQAVRRRKARAVAAALQKQQEAQESEAKEMRTILGSIHQLSISSTTESSIPVRTPISTLSTKALSNINVDMIKRLQSFTNINFTSIHNQLLSTSESGGMKARQYHITGTCFQLGFMVEFTVREHSLDLKDVRIEVPRSAQKELGRFVSRAERERMLMPFFRTLAQYAQMDYDRQVLMSRLAKRFPQLVKSSRAIRKLSRASSTGSAAASLPPSGSPAGPGVQTMTFSLAKRSSPELVLQWTIDATGQGKIVPQVRLFPRMPQKWRQADEKMTLDGIPTQFVRLVQLKGTEGAAAVVVKCVFGRRAAEAGDTNSDTEIDTDTNGVSA